MTSPPANSVLLVDDNPANLYALSEILSDMGLALVTAGSGAEALRLVVERDFAAVLLDVRMPGMDGFEAATLMRERPRSRHTPILFLTAEGGDQSAQFQGYAVGAVDYLVKPLVPHVVRAKVRVFAELAASRQALQVAQNELQALNAQLESRVQVRTQELREARDAAQAASQAKSEFLANMGHEIRTPMNAVMGLSYLALQHEADPAQRARLGKIDAAAQSLLHILEDILDLSTMESGQLSLRLAPFDLSKMLADVAGMTALMAQEKKLQFTFEADPDLPPRLVGDRLRIRQVLSNLCSNAVKFTEQGGVTLVVRRLAGDGRAVRLEFAVRDTGIGISSLDQTKLFEPFSQTDSSSTRKYGGAGLGLSIARQLVALMGGRVWVTSTPGQGSTFGFGLVCETDPLPSGAPPNLAGRRILVVEDDSVSRMVAIGLLEAAGVTVTTANNGQEALCAMLDPNPQGPPDAILMDVQMPGMDGLEATRQLRRRPELADLPIIAMSANTEPHDRAMALAAGLNAFIAKPVDVYLLYQVLGQWLGSGGREV